MRMPVNADASTLYSGPDMLWVNATGLVAEFPAYDNPIAPFPYTRLAVTTPPASKAFYLYHQINASTLAEDIYDTAVSSWGSTNITISMV